MYKKNLLKKCLCALYDRRTNKMLVKTMTQQAEAYHMDNLKSKSFESIVWYFEKQQRKADLAALGEDIFKRRFLSKWLNALNRSLQFKEQLESEIISTKIKNHSRISSLDIHQLNTEDELKKAHEILSIKLKDMISDGAVRED